MQYQIIYPMKQIINSLFLGVGIIFLASCSSSLSSKAKGTYSGTYTVSGVPVGTGTVAITEVDNETVNLTATHPNFTYTFSNVALSEQNSIVILGFTNGNETLTGSVAENVLNLTYTNGNVTTVFTGNK